MDFELDIEKYTLEDLLALFHLTVQFDERDLKNARKSVLRLHPDKSHLDPTYFIFYTKAYNMLLGIWKFRQGSSGDKNTAYSLHEQEDQRGRQGFIDKKMKEEEFNSWFNREFEKAKVENPHTDKGYGQWLVADETESPGADIHQVKRNARQLVVAREVSCASSSASFGEMTDQESSALVSFQIKDLFTKIYKSHIQRPLFPLPKRTIFTTVNSLVL